MCGTTPVRDRQGSRVTQTSSDPTAQWSRQLDRLDGVLRDAVVAALRRSASNGWPASRDGVELLVAYALGEITSQQYVAGILRSWGVPLDDRVHGAPPRRAQEPEPQPEPGPEPPRVRTPREEAVHAYVTGQIDVGEFLRISRS
jgi:hypothetical protein